MTDSAGVDGSHVVIRVMRPEEFETMRGLSVSAFGGDPQIRDLLDGLYESWAWDDALSFVAELDGQLVGQVLYTHAYLDAPNRLVDVLVLSPIGVRPDHQNRGIGSRLIRETLTRLGPRAESMVFLEGSPRYYPTIRLPTGVGPWLHTAISSGPTRCVHGLSPSQLRNMDDRCVGLSGRVLEDRRSRPPRLDSWMKARPIPG